ncbi:ceramidase domain-containing protein [Calidifontibacter indicus]|uniref:ceramidase domain-containing protein n=1 Tax=Calidifontibacter indicus TaxID=419650 RepID=UPI003D71249C
MTIATQGRTATALAAVCSLGLFAAAVTAGRLGVDVGVGSQFCEAAHDGWVRQPANTYSNLGFVVAGLAIGAYVDRRRGQLRARLEHPGLLVAYGVLVVVLGPASMAMHATGTRLGGRLDVLSMHLLAGFTAAYALTRLLRRGGGFLAVAFTAFVVGAQSVAEHGGKVPLVDAAGNAAFAVLLLLGLAGELVLRCRPGGRRPLAPAVGALLAMLVAFGIWTLSHSGGVWCDPHSLLQGHAVWHLLCALAAYLLFRYYAGRPAD